jgi:hypothetical protein
MKKSAVLHLSLVIQIALFAAERRPNSIHHRADERGFDEPAFAGGKTIRTQNLDRMAAAGMRFTNTSGGHPVGGPQPVPKPAGDFSREKAEDKSGDWKGIYVERAKNLLDCVKSRKTPNADLASSHRVNATCHLAKISARTGRQVVWDRVANDIVGDKEASAMLQQPNRAAWVAEIKALLS